MSDINITVDGGTSKRLLTAGKLCDRNILVTATGGGGDLPEEAFGFHGDISYTFSQGNWDWFIERYGHRITTENINNLYFAFANSTVERIPFVINASDPTIDMGYAFNGGNNLLEAPKIRFSNSMINLPSEPGYFWGSFNMQYLFNACHNIRDFENVFIPEDLDGFSNLWLESPWMSTYLNCIFYYCQAMRTVPSWFYKLRFHELSPYLPYCGYSVYNYAFAGCAALDEVLNLQVLTAIETQTENMFDCTFNTCYRLKNVTFETHEDGTPLTARWNNQVIDLSYGLGEVWDTNFISHNSGIGWEHEVSNDTDYNNLKDDPNWWTRYTAYSRYNRDSAVATINSLPDTSEVGGGNTIKFKGDSGSSTDVGAVGTLTEEEIAVAAAKGWTVSFA